MDITTLFAGFQTFESYCWDLVVRSEAIVLFERQIQIILASFQTTTWSPVVLDNIDVHS